MEMYVQLFVTFNSINDKGSFTKGQGFTCLQNAKLSAPSTIHVVCIKLYKNIIIAYKSTNNKITNIIIAYNNKNYNYRVFEKKVEKLKN